MNPEVDLGKIKMVEIEIFSQCNRQCWFCPNSFLDRRSEQHYLEESTYLKILEELAQASFAGTVSYSRYNEPLCDPILFDRLKQARRLLPQAKLHFNTNGDFLHAEVLQRLRDCGLSSCNIQCYLGETEALDPISLRRRFNRWAQKLNLEQRPLPVSRLTPSQVGIELLDPSIKIKVYARDFRRDGNNRGGSLKTIAAAKRRGACPIPFRDLYVDYNGNVMPCCNLRSDNPEHRRFIMGNASTQSLREILTGPAFLAFRQAVAQEPISFAPCCECSFFDSPAPARPVAAFSTKKGSSNMSESLYQKLAENKKGFFLLAGPCVIESRECVFAVAEKMKEITQKLQIPYVFKASFDKANRTSIKSYRGPGLSEGLAILAEVKQKLGLPIVTDIHTPEQAAAAAGVADILQIPAFLCRQTDLIVAAAKTGLPVNIKKAQFLSPFDMKNVLKKAEDSGNRQLFLCERGSCFGYNALVVDMTAIVEMKRLGYPVIFDATHSVQKPGGNGTSTGGNRGYVRYLSRAAAAVGADGFFMEVHPDPDSALSDGPNMVPLDEVEPLLTELLKITRLIQDLEGGTEYGA